MRFMFLFYFLIFPIIAYANVTVTNTIYGDKFTYIVGENVTILTTIQGEFDDSKIQDFKIESNENYRFNGVVNRYSSSSVSVQIINGKMTKKVERTVNIVSLVKVLKKGKITIASPQFKLDGKIYKGNDIVVKVIDKKDALAKSQEEDAKNLVPDMWFRIIPSKSRLKVGEEAILTIVFGPRADIRISSINAPDIEKIKKELSGTFLVKELFSSMEDVRKTLQQKVINGKKYNLYTMKMAIYPLKEDTVFLGPYTISYTLLKNVRSYDPFDMFFQNVESVPQEKKSNMIEIFIKDMGVTAGEYRISYDISVQNNRIDSIKVGDPINIKFIISGKGNIEQLEPLKWKLSSEFLAYDPEISYKFIKQSNGFFAKKTYTYLIIPQFEGEYVLPPFKVPYFNIKSNKVDTLIIDNLKLKIYKNTIKNAITISNNGSTLVTQKNINTVFSIKKDIEYIITNKLDQQKFFYKQKNLIRLALLLLFLNIIALFLPFIKNFVGRINISNHTLKLITAIKQENIGELDRLIKSFIVQETHGKLKGLSYDDLIEIARKNDFKELRLLAQFGQAVEMARLQNDKSFLWQNIDKNELLEIVRKLKGHKKWQELA